MIKGRVLYNNYVPEKKDSLGQTCQNVMFLCSRNMCSSIVPASAKRGATWFMCFTLFHPSTGSVLGQYWKTGNTGKLL